MSRLTNIVEIINFLEKYEIKNATINKDFTVDVDGDAILGVLNIVLGGLEMIFIVIIITLLLLNIVLDGLKIIFVVMVIQNLNL